MGAPPVVEAVPVAAASSVEGSSSARKKARRGMSGEELGDHTVESLLTLHRDRLVEEMDDEFARLVEGMHEACSKQVESLRNEFRVVEEEASKKRSVVLSAVSGPHAGARFELTCVESSPCFVGRSTGKRFRVNGVSLPKDDEVSTTHAKIEVKKGGETICVVDVGSTNGTTLDDVELEQGIPKPLKNDGSVLVVGSTKFTVSCKN